MHGNGVFTLANTDADKKWVVETCVEMFTPTLTLTQMQIAFKPIVLVSVPESVKVKYVSVLDSVNTQVI